MFNFQLGKLSIKASRNGILIVVFPVGEHVIAVQAEAFEKVLDMPSSISAKIEIYHKDDHVVTGKVQRWIKDAEETSKQ